MLAPARHHSESPATVAVTCAVMKGLEQRAFADGITAEALMEQAGERIAAAVRQFIRGPGRCVVFFGKGHNGGDALVAARHLAVSGWKIDLRPAFPSADWAPLTARKHAELFALCPQSGIAPGR